MAKKLIVTDHAIVRFLERGKGKNIDKIKTEIIKAMNNGKLKCVVKDGVIITILPKQEDNS